MNGSSSITSAFPIWYVLLCLIVGALYAWFLYTKKAPWNKTINYTLAFFRFALVTIICLLFLDWIINRSSSAVEKPVVVMAIDNSQSIPMNSDSATIKKAISRLKKLKSDLEASGKDVYIQSFDHINDQLDSIRFNTPETNLSKLLKQVSDNFEGRNLSGITLLSDGIYNRGISPEYSDFNTPVFAIGLGDTSSKKDIKIKSLGLNKIAYKDNIFPIRAEILNNGYAGQKSKVHLLKGGKTLDTKEITFTDDFEIQEIDFQTSSSSTGIQHYVVKVEPLTKEFTTDNNIKHAYIEVLDGKEEILCVALTPHPDIKALKSAIEQNANIHFNTHIISRGDELKNDQNYDLIIFHQVPNKLNKGNDLLNKYLNDKKPALFIAGNQSNLKRLNQLNTCVEINQKGNQTDDVSPYFTKGFDLFTYDQELKNRLPKFPPLQVPFGDYKIKPGGNVVLNQKIGSVATQKPVLVINTENEIKRGILCGEGIWRWRLDEYRSHENTTAFDQLIQKTIQTLSAKNDKRKFRLYTTDNEYSEHDEVIFVAETYNDIYENIYDQEIRIKITNENGESQQHKFVTSEINSRYKLKGLKEGIYKYSASTKISGKTLYSTGEFVVKKIRLESSDLQANHTLLREIARKSSGQFIYPDNIPSLIEYFNSDKVAGVVHTDTTRDALINEKWIFFVLLLLATLEWGLRKNKGGY